MGLIAILVSMLGIIIYLAWRFEFIFGVAAAIATFHDVLAVLGIFYLLHLEITLLVVTALFTLAGYSLTDTVVVFDRIRENLIKVRDSLGEIINVSINEVLSRTIVTSTTVFLVVLALFLFGGVVIRDFALAMLLGVIIVLLVRLWLALLFMPGARTLRKWRSRRKGQRVGSPTAKTDPKKKKRPNAKTPGSIPVKQLLLTGRTK